MIDLPCKPKRNTAWIINIGTELLMGVTVNTNGSWMARKLTVNGVLVNRVIVVPDKYEEASDVLNEAIKRKIGFILTTGGLGPTYDDSTAKFVAQTLSVGLEKNTVAYQMISEKYSEMREPMTPPRKKMSYLPKGSIPIPNNVGTAPGFMLCYNDTLMASFPGVPREMKSMFENYFEPLIRKITGKKLFEEHVEISGIKESSLAPIVNYLAKKYSKAYIKSHPKGFEGEKPLINLQLSIVNKDEKTAKKIIDEVKKELWKKVKKIKN